ncbi:LEAF RUST 10 DISEASE-RESISTANCE LOCUS RECEPTOR-LIKE PROTEIN KINASE-like 1.4 isoform X8 [Quercus robur]|uniref:LEAF RUST 10 DISEASE-RESISTANCE LOCUS RECEPTOR-LIKE PROTEIN KINASE-like 1.4 isoform X8 n=1 Tax=Quercus robur TaxID=38942 RepID=UPI002163D385|nr:LEAF RUST 10 DISEASE-RESISTANCE LOCUS RECEPTOR-LIKE PROTEIN KINASE-like 1.4 isoform X8 [Quercus robur]
MGQPSRSPNSPSKTTALPSKERLHHLTLQPFPPQSMYPFIFFFFFLFFLSVSATTSFPTSVNKFDECYQAPFDCGPFKNLSQPFTSQTRPANCAQTQTEFLLTKCDATDSESPELTIPPLSYRVLRLNQTNKTMTLARSDLWENTCLTEFTNTSLGSTILNYTSDNEDLTIYYGCNADFSLKPTNQFNCSINGKVSASFYLTGPVPTDPVLNITTCQVGVRLKILQTAAIELTTNRSALKEALMSGFNVTYSDCGTQLCPNPEQKSEVSLRVGIAIAGAAIAGIFLGFLVFSIRKQKKRRAQESKSKDLPTPPSSTGGPASSNFARSIPSYPYSKSDLEKGSTYFGAQIFSYDELEEATNNFDTSRELGDGGFGTVYYGKLHDGRVVAVKRLYENNLKRVEQFMNEVEILTKIRHKNLVTLYGCTSKRSQELLLVYEYIPNGTVADHLHGNRSKSGLLTWPVRLSIAIESAEALAYLHVSDVIHRDVKTNNILLDEKFQVKVADFGLSRLFPTDVTHVSTAPQGTPGYVDPEYFQCYQLTQKSDVYSFGVVLMELISSLPAVDMNRHRQDINLVNMAVNKTQNNALHELVDPLLGFEKDYTVKKMTTSVAELAFRCLEKERDMRPSMDEVLEILRGIQNGNEEMGAQKAEVVDIKAADDVRLLKNIPPPLSSDSVVTDKWVNSPTTPHSS